MGSYNPSAPIILGEEWVGIRDETITFPPGIPNSEVGFTFALAQSRTLQEVRFYLDDWPSTDGQTILVNLYTADTEDDSGPVKSVIIPCNNGSVTAGTGGSVSFVNATSFADAVATPSDNKYISATMGRDSATPSKHQAYFAVNSFAQTLYGKRILGVNLLYSLGNTGYSRPFEERPGWQVYLAGDALSPIAYGAADAGGIFGNLVQNTSLGRPTTHSSMEMGNFNHFWSSSTLPSATSERLPWTFENLARFEISATNRYSVYLTGSDDGDAVVAGSIEYLALEVFYCEERRVAIGGREYGVSLPATLRNAWVSNANIVPVRTTALASNPVLAAGEYLLTVSLGSKGFFTPQASPELVALRELDAISSFEGMQVNVPYPWNDNTIDQELTSEQVHVIPQLSVHTSGGALTEPHVYGRLAKAPVYGTVTATQEILDGAAGGANSYPQVRFYGRRFGDTSVRLTLDSPTIAGSSVTLAPAEWDALPELVDDWKEVTLRFDTAPSMGTGTNPQWRFSAAGEAAGNQWQVLGLSAPALSGTPGNLNTPVPSPHTLGAATYGAPSAGTTINLGWLSPLVSTTTDDQNSDAVLIFSTDPPTPTDVAVEVAEQELSIVDPTCFAAGCVPTSLYYNQISWTPVSGAAYDDFDDRTASNGWGTAPIGGAWTVSGTASDFSVSGGVGNMLLSSTTSRRAVIGVNTPDVDVSATFIFPAAASGGDLGGDIAVRYTDSDNNYLGRIRGTTTGTVLAQIDKRVASVQTTLSAVATLPFNHVAGTRVRMRMQAVATTLRFKAWPDGTSEPDAWNAEVTDTSHTTGVVGMRGIAGSGNVNIPITVSWDDFESGPFGFGTYELQRYDPVDGEFFTIMEATGAALETFNDYEARVGQPSVYRLRTTNLYDFAGLWSPQVTATVTSPGVVGADTTVLMFTTNARQDGSSNLAYSAAWENNPVEDFAWPEAGAVVLQDMFNKNYATAFRPLERGGERFARQILVNAAGIPPATSAHGFESLRNMAWDTVPYVCVRNEEGDRWYSAVVVPSGSVRRMIVMGRLCMAAVQVIEVTDTPYPVDPS